MPILSYPLHDHSVLLKFFNKKTYIKRYCWRRFGIFIIRLWRQRKLGSMRITLSHNLLSLLILTASLMFSSKDLVLRIFSFLFLYINKIYVQLDFIFFHMMSQKPGQGLCASLLSLSRVEKGRTISLSLSSQKLGQFSAVSWDGSGFYWSRRDPSIIACPSFHLSFLISLIWIILFMEIGVLRRNYVKD